MVDDNKNADSQSKKNTYEANQPQTGGDLMSPFPPPIAVPEDPPDESSKLNGLLALWGPLILIGALIFIFQGDRDANDSTGVGMVAMTQLPVSADKTTRTGRAEKETGDQTATPAESAGDQAMEPTIAAVTQPSVDAEPPAAAEPLTTTVARSMAAVQIPMTGDSSSTAIVDLPVYPAVTGPYRVRSPWRTAPAASVYPGQQPRSFSAPGTATYGGGLHWTPCPPPHYWCIIPMRMNFGW